MSKTTQRYKRLHRLVLFIEYIGLFLPIAYYTAKGFIFATTTEKITLTAFGIIACILTAICIMFKFNFKSPIWFLIIGIYTAVDNIMPLILSLAIGTVISEFILIPLRKNFAAKAKINAEIDRRLEK